MTKSLEGHSAYKDLSLREMRILQYLHQRTGTLKRHVFVPGTAPEDPRPLEDIIEIDAEIEKIRYALIPIDLFPLSSFSSFRYCGCDFFSRPRFVFLSFLVYLANQFLQPCYSFFARPRQ